MKHREILQQFAAMGLDLDEVSAFFTVLSADCGGADYNEFITGALALACSAPTLDRLKEMQRQMKLESVVNSSARSLARICKHLDIDPAQDSI